MEGEGGGYGVRGAVGLEVVAPFDVRLEIEIFDEELERGGVGGGGGVEVGF